MSHTQARQRDVKNEIQALLHAQRTVRQGNVTVFVLEFCMRSPLLPAMPYDPGEQGDPLQAEAPAANERLVEPAA